MALDQPEQPGLATTRLDRFLAENHPPTPFVVVDLDVVRARYNALREALPAAEIYYAVKANPAVEIVSALAALGANFDLASPGELVICLGLHVPPSRLSFGNTVKSERAIAGASDDGIDLFAFDSQPELDKLARAAPEARVFCRLLIENKGAEWPLTRKFGCEAHMAADLLVGASRLGLRPIGVSFHVGSQQTDPQAWSNAISHVAWVFRACAHRGVDLELLNLGGGLPAHYRAPIPPLGEYAEEIENALTREFGSARPRIFIEPGRYLVGDAGLLRAEVLLISRKSPHEQERWVYLDAGLYNGLDETLNERIHYRIRTPRDGAPSGPVILAGPTCDSTDILYRRHPYELPLDLEIGDPVDFLSAGAYTTSVAAVAFNGFSPIQSYLI
jgi:ornithine decarboxylase